MAPVGSPVLEGAGALPLGAGNAAPSRALPVRSSGLLPELCSSSSSRGPRTSHASRSDKSRAPSSCSSSGRRIPSLHKYFGNPAIMEKEMQKHPVRQELSELGHWEQGGQWGWAGPAVPRVVPFPVPPCRNALSRPSRSLHGSRPGKRGGG